MIDWAVQLCEALEYLHTRTPPVIVCLPDSAELFRRGIASGSQTDRILHIVLKLVGQGGMSKVYLAMDKRLNKQWAVKEIRGTPWSPLHGR